MDFEMAIWEMTSLLIAPKKVFRSIYYHVSQIRQLTPIPNFKLPILIYLRRRNVSKIHLLPKPHIHQDPPPNLAPVLCARADTETKNTWHRPDPSFTYLLSFFMLVTGIAWGIAYTSSVGATIRLIILFVFVHFLLISLLVATAAYFLVGRLLGPGIAGLPGRRRQQGLFTRVGEGESLEFGYCFDVRGTLDRCSNVSRFVKSNKSFRLPFGLSFPSGSLYMFYNSCCGR